MDIYTVGGISFAIFCILFGQYLEGGHASSLVQLTAFIIVLGGTIGACMVAFPKEMFNLGLKLGKIAIQNHPDHTEEIIQKLVELATVARREGVLALEQRLSSIEDPFMAKSLRFIVDGADASITRDFLETQIFMEFELNTKAAKVYESAGGFAPTVGILGAVLGLIHVMENLDDPSKLGPGIAVAFVATVYGVGASNLIFLPLANKIKMKLTHEKERKTLIAEGVLAIQEGMNPRLVEDKLWAYSGHQKPA